MAVGFSIGPRAFPKPTYETPEQRRRRQDHDRAAQNVEGFENYMFANPGARPMGMDALPASHGQGSVQGWGTGLNPGDAQGWAKLLERQQGYLADKAMIEGRQGPTVRFGGHSPGLGVAPRSAPARLPAGSAAGGGSDMTSEAYTELDPFGDRARHKRKLELDMLSEALAGAKLGNRSTELGLEGDRLGLEGARTKNAHASELFDRFKATPREGSGGWYARQNYEHAQDVDRGELGKDVAVSRAARRFEFPEVRRQREEEQRNAISRASASATTAGASRERVAGMQTRAQMAMAAGRRPTAVEIVGDFMDELGTSYGTDPRTGAAQLPPDVAQLRDRLVSESSGMLSGGAGRSGGAGPAGAPGGAMNPADQAFVARAKAEGYSDGEIQMFLSSRQGR